MKQTPVTWVVEGQFNSATFTKKTRKIFHCEGCHCNLPIGASAWRVWPAGEKTYSVCVPCWDHFHGCFECYSEPTTWEQAAICRLEAEHERRESE